MSWDLVPLRGGKEGGSRAMLTKQVNKDTQITIRLDAEFVQQVDALIARLGGVAVRAALLREAMRLGWPLLEQNYEGLKAPKAKPSKRKPRG